MTLPSDLLHQADFLSKREPKKPRQASLRRAVSAAYYALFHLLTGEAARVFVKDMRLVNCLNRAYSHGEMNEVSKKFAEGDWPQTFNVLKPTVRLPQELRNVAKAFVDLQQARHDADYNLSMNFTRSDVNTFVEMSQQAFKDWGKIRKSDLARIYLGAFLLTKAWDKTR